MIDKYPIGFTFTIVGEDASRTYTITSHRKQTISELQRNVPPEFDYVMRDENGTPYLTKHDFVQACVELAGKNPDE